MARGDSDEQPTWELEVRSKDGKLLDTHVFNEQPTVDTDVEGFLKYESEAEGVTVLVERSNVGMTVLRERG